MPACITPAIGLGRGITNYLPHCEMNAQLKQAMQAKNDTEFRKQLQHTPEKVDFVARDMVSFLPYWPVSPCPTLPY